MWFWDSIQGLLDAFGFASCGNCMYLDLRVCSELFCMCPHLRISVLLQSEKHWLLGTCTHTCSGRFPEFPEALPGTKENVKSWCCAQGGRAQFFLETRSRRSGTSLRSRAKTEHEEATFAKQQLTTSAPAPAPGPGRDRTAQRLQVRHFWSFVHRGVRR